MTSPIARRLWLGALLGASLLLIGGCTSTPRPEASTAADRGVPITAASTRIVRGANQCPLTAQSIGGGNNPHVGPDEPLTDLSVNASDDKNVSYADLARSLPNAHYGWATLGDLRRSNRQVLLVRDPLPGNPYHCLLSVITPREVAGRMNCR